MHFSNSYLIRLRTLPLHPLPMAIVIASLVLLCTIGSGLSIYVILKNAYVEELRNDLRNTAVALAASVDPELHEQLQTHQQQNSSLYSTMNRPLTEVMEQSRGIITYAYTMVKRGDSLFFVLDGTPSGDLDSDGIEDKSQIMEHYESTTPEMMIPFETGAVHIDSKPSCDKWGCFLSAYAPIKTASGEVIAILGVDMSVHEYENRMVMVYKTAAVLTVVALILSILIGIFTYYALFYIRKMIREAERLALLKGEFLAVMSHEIRTPLNGIIGISHNLDHFIEDAEGHELLQTMQMSGMGLLQIINDILDFSKIEAGKMTLDPQPTNLMAAVKDIERIFSADFSKKDLEFISLIDELVPSKVLVDPLRLRQVLTNLVGNAVKFTHEGGQITLTITVVDSLLHFCLADTGVGIAPEAINQLFQPFVQAEKGISRKFGGTGLGLMITRNLVNLMEGTITCESELGKGTRFLWNIPSIPIEQSSVEETIEPINSISIPESDSGRYRHKKVLVVDDQDVNLKVAKLMLSKFGIAADVCSSGFESLEMVTARTYDLIFLDIQMPEMDGITTFSLMNQEIENFAVPVAALTANVMHEDQLHYQEQGIPFFLAKPIIMGELEHLLDRVFSQSKV